MKNIPETLLRNLFIAVLIVFALVIAGCISQQPEVLKVNPVIDYNPLEGFHNRSESMFTVINGSIPEVKESLKDIVIKKAAQTSTFSTDDELNFVVFRGVFGTGGYGINIDRVEKHGNIFTIYATYRDPGKGVGVTLAFTQPVAIIPIGKLAAGDYKARLRVTRVKEDTDDSGTKIIRRVIEPEKELEVFSFKVEPPEESFYHYIGYDYNYTGVGRFDPKQASIVWNKINSSDEAKFVTSEKSYSAVVFMHPYTVGAFDPSTAEWIAVISSIPEMIEEPKIAIFRLDYQTLDLKKSYKFSYPARKELSLEESVAIMENEIKPGDKFVDKKKVTVQGGNYIYSYPAADFGGTIIVNKYAGIAIFFATTVWDGRGKLIIPEDGELSGTPLKFSPSGYLSGQAFDETSGILTKKWYAGNFNGFWRDSETGDSTENLAIDQGILNNTHRVIEKHNLIYTTRPVPINYQVYRQTGKAPEGTQGFYEAIGWLGEKYVFFPENRIARIIFEQNASDIKNITTGYLWVFGDGYRLLAHSIEAPLEREAWIEFLNDSNKLDEVVLPDRYLYSYPANTNSIPIFITYISSIHRGPYEETGEFKHTWLRSQDIGEIRKGQVYGVMEVVSVNNGIIELRNKEPIDLAPGSTISLMGNISIQVGNSTTSLQFYPESTRRYSTLPSLIDTISAAHPVLKNYTGVREVAEDYYFRDYIQQCCDEGLKFIINASSKRGGNEESIVVTLQNDFTGKERLKTIEIIPEKGEAIAPNIISKGNWSGYKSQAFMIINSTEEWNNIWQKHVSYLSGQKPSLPEINFASETIVAVFSGTSPEYDIELINITRESGIVFVNLRGTYPARLSLAEPYFIYRIPKIRENVIFRTLKWEYSMPAGPTLAQAYSAAELKANTQILMKYMPQAFNDSDINAIFTEIASIIKTVDGRKYDNVTAKLMSESAGLVSQDVWNYEFVFVLEGIRDNKAEWWRMKIYYTTGERVSIPYPEGPTPGRIFN